MQFETRTGREGPGGEN